MIKFKSHVCIALCLFQGCNRIVQYSVDQISVFGKATIHEY